MGLLNKISNFFNPKTRKAQKFYSAPSLMPSSMERSEILNLINNAAPDSNFALIRNQARSISSASPLIVGYFDTLDSEIFGENGIILDMHSANAALNTKIENQFYKWRQNIPNSAVDFWEIESAVLLHLKRDGEAFVYFENTKQGLSVRIIDPANVDETLDDGAKIRYGVEFDNANKPIAYFVKDSSYQTKRISAHSVLHIFKRISSIQTRGVSALASVIYPTYQKDKFKSAELTRARLQSEITGYIQQDGEFDIAPFDLDDEGDEVKKEVKETAEVGKMMLLEKGLKPTFIESHNATNIEFFIKQTDREIARALGVAYSTLTGDLREVNYSSIRHGASEQRRQFRALQNFIIRHLHNKIFEAWVKNEAILGRISPKNAKIALENFTFKAQGWEYIDPKKEVEANKVALESGQKTLMDILRAQGKELDSHIDELQKEGVIYEILKNRSLRPTS